MQAVGGGQHRGRRGAETEDRAAAEGETASAAGQQHDAPAALFQVGGAPSLAVCVSNACSGALTKV